MNGGNVRLGHTEQKPLSDVVPAFEPRDRDIERAFAMDVLPVPSINRKQCQLEGSSICRGMIMCDDYSPGTPNCWVVAYELIRVVPKGRISSCQLDVSLLRDTTNRRNRWR